MLWEDFTLGIKNILTKSRQCAQLCKVYVIWSCLYVFAGYQCPCMCDRKAHQPGRNPRTYLSHWPWSFPWDWELHQRGVLHEHVGFYTWLPGQDLRCAGTPIYPFSGLVLVEIWESAFTVEHTDYYLICPLTLTAFNFSFEVTMRDFRAESQSEPPICLTLSLISSYHTNRSFLSLLIENW